MIELEMYFNESEMAGATDLKSLAAALSSPVALEQDNRSNRLDALPRL